MISDIKVLVVDDEPSILETFKITLKVKKYKVGTFLDGVSALENLKKGEYQVAFIDLKLPGMDGLEVMQKVKEKDPNLNVIIMTAYATDISQTNAMNLGALEYLRKPFLMEEVYELIERGLRRKETRR